MDLENLIIQQMAVSDLEQIKDCLYTDFDNFWEYSILEEELLSDFSTYFVAKYDNEIVGFAGLKLIIDEAELMNIVTKKSERNKGIASSLLVYLINFCKINNMSIINLEVNVKNSIAINFYKKYNFKQVGLRKNYYNNIESAILMSLEL